ncbi:phosphate signaling complex PhoU family protein [Hydrogenimonas sp.]
MLSNFQEKLDQINGMMRELAGMILTGEELCFEGFKTKNMETLESAREAVKGCRPKANEIDNEVIKTLALFGPEATQLREMVGYLKITNELVNSASNIRTYVKHNKALIASGFDMSGLEASFIPLHRSALNATKHMVDMIDLNRSEEEIRTLYRHIKVEESKGDDLYAIVQKDISEMLCRIDVDPLDFITVLKLARKLEQISDHAINIAKLLLYIKTGGELESH